MAGSDLTSAFGMPAANSLADRLGRNPRRERRERGPGETPAAAPVEEQPPSDEAATATTEKVARDAFDAPAASATTPTVAEPVSDGTGSHGEPPQDNRSHNTSRRVQSRGATATGSSTRKTSGGRARGGGRAPQNVELDANTSYPVPIYVHPAVKTAASSRRKEFKLTNAEIAFDALDEVQHRLAGLVRDRRLRARPDTSLFPGRVRRGRLAGGRAEGAATDVRMVLYQFRATEAELEIIDRLVAESGAESRSELVAAAMEESLLKGS